MSAITDALGLVIDDRDPQAIFDAGIAAFVEMQPNAVVRNGSDEAALIQAAAVMAADAIYVANRQVAVLLEGILSFVGARRDQGQPARGIVTVTLDGTQTGTIAAGTTMTAAGIDLTVTSTVTYTDLASITIPVACAEPGAAGNALTAGTEVTVDDDIPYLAAAAVTSSLTGGSDAESDAAYIARAGNVMARLLSSLVKGEHLTAYCLEDVRVGQATTIRLWNGIDPATIDADAGHMTTVLDGRGGIPLDPDVLDEKRREMQDMVSASTTPHTRAAGIVVQPFDLAVHPVTGSDADTVIAAVENALRTWCSRTTWPFGETIRVNEVIALAGAVTGVDYVVAVTTPAADVSLDPFALADAGSITVSLA